MPANDDPESLVSLKALSSGNVGSTASSHEENCHDPSVDIPVDATPPPAVKLTVYRLLNMTTTLAFCLTKGILACKGLSTVPTTLDCVSGGVLVVVLYWVGLYDGRDSKKWEWFFQVDLAPAIGYSTKRVMGAALWLLFHKNLFSLALEGSVTSIVVGLLDYFPSYTAMPVGAKLGIFLGMAVFVFGFQYCLGALTRQVQARAWASRWAIVLVDDYGPGVPLAERYWWFGLTGTVVGLICGLAFAGLQVVVLFNIFVLTYGRIQTSPCGQ
ncbi:hypothetical protein V8E53_005661 [Lactarius tabidus]